MELWKLHEKQKEALQVIERNKFALLIGQGRSSKTTLIVWYLFYRAWKYPKTSHVIFRNTLTSAIDGIFAQTVNEVVRHFYPVLPSLRGFQINRSNHVIHLPNGSRILIRGLDSEEKATKILSQQFATVALDEVQTISHTYFSLLLTRLPQPKDADYDVKIVCSANYAPKTHWSKVFFADGLNPETKTPHNQQAEYLKFVTEDNKAIDAISYIETIMSAGDRRSKLMCAGTDWFEEAEGALWDISDIRRETALDLNQYRDIVISLDPSTTNTSTSDEHGVAICGKLNGKYHVIMAYEKKGDVNVIAKEVCNLYHEYKCSKLLYETNQGGDWVKSLIQNHDSKVLCHGIRATRGKLIRAEPISALYKNGLVFHCRQFRQLEEQMLTYTGAGDSPNALDALVHCLQYLSEGVKYVDPNRI